MSEWRTTEEEMKVLGGSQYWAHAVGSSMGDWTSKWPF